MPTIPKKKKIVEIKTPTNNSSSFPRGGRQNENKWSHHSLLDAGKNLELVWKIICWINNSYFIYFYAFLKLISARPYPIKPKGTAVIQKWRYVFEMESEQRCRKWVKWEIKLDSIRVDRLVCEGKSTGSYFRVKKKKWFFRWEPQLAAICWIPSEDVFYLPCTMVYNYPSQH